MSNNVECNILKLIRDSGGELSLSNLTFYYMRAYGEPFVFSGKLRDWVKRFDSIGTRRIPGTNDTVAYETPRAPHLIERNILDLIQRSGGQISLSVLKDRYRAAYGDTINAPSGKLRDWVDSFESIGTRKVHPNDVVVVPKVVEVKDSYISSPPPSLPPPRPLTQRPLTTSVSKMTPSKRQSSGLESIEIIEFGSCFSELSMAREVAEETKFNCVEIEEKLMGYMNGQFRPIKVHQESQSLLDLLPPHWSKTMVDVGIEEVTDISLDLGRRPYFWHKNRRVYFSDDYHHTVSNLELEDIVGRLQEIGDDNRSGLDNQLHRISVIRNNSDTIIGLTIRVGRHVEGNADIIRDLLEEDAKSILLLGEPGSGKTTIVREMTKILSRKQNVFVVDTSNEIAGNGNMPHPCIGDARRMMVKTLQSQSATMIECVQNHTPSVMIIDEIGRKREVEAAQTSKNRGVRMIASAHGDLRSLVKNKEIRGLIGGLEKVTLGDEEAKKLQKKKGTKNLEKQCTQREGEPIFDIVIELKRGRLNEWHVVPNAAKAVDDILFGKRYDVQKRMRCINSGRIFVEHVKN